MAEESTGGLQLAPDTFWLHALGTEKVAVDPLIRRVISAIQSRDFAELARRTGITRSSLATKKVVDLPLMVELVRKDGNLVRPPPELGLKIPEAYYEEAERNPELTHVTARLELGAEIFDGEVKAAREKIAAALLSQHVKRLTLAAPLQPCLQEAAQQANLPDNRVFRGKSLTGKGVIVGIIDDGCALAHQDFLAPLGRSGLQSRIRYLWNQSGAASAASAAAGWTQPADFGYGLELTKAAIDRALAKPGSIGKRRTVDTAKVHELLDFTQADLASHGTHVMSIAAGNGRSAMGSSGMASEAEIVFVQLPQMAVASGGAVLYDSILDGVMYIFSRARQLNLPAVINISYGGYTGPHDGTTELEAGIDQLLALDDRSVVVAAGNGFEADCHASGVIAPGGGATPLQWVVRPEDPTSNYLEIWYNGDTTLDATLTAPDANTPLGPVAPGARFDINRTYDQQLVGAVDHTQSPGNGDRCITFILSATGASPVSGGIAQGTQAAPLPVTAAATPGIWTIGLKNTGTKPAEYHAWIERDVTGGRGSARRQQSHFVATQANPTHTLGGLATGHRTVAVGAYNGATQEISRYSACGPTRAIGSDPLTVRRKPEVCAPGESDPAGRGTLCASSLRAQPTRMNGTSASAPQVAGLMAIMYQYIRDKGRPKLTAGQMRDKVVRGAQSSSALALNRHQTVDDTRPHKQKDVPRADLAGSGKLNAKETLRLL